MPDKHRSQTGFSTRPPDRFACDCDRHSGALDGDCEIDILLKNDFVIEVCDALAHLSTARSKLDQLSEADPLVLPHALVAEDVLRGTAGAQVSP